MRTFNYNLLRALCVHIMIMQHYKRNCNPWTASKSDRATKIIVTLLFNDGFQKCTNSFEADEILYGK